MSEIGRTSFDTPIGNCEIAWSERGVTRLRLPNALEAAASETVARMGVSADSPSIRSAVEGVIALLRGEQTDLSTIDVDLAEASEFEQQVYAVARTIQPGQIMTYGEVAERLGDRGAAQAVGRALGRNPVPIIVPCHRVLAAGGRTGGFSAPGGVGTKLRILSIERAQVGEFGLFAHLPLAAKAR